MKFESGDGSATGIEVHLDAGGKPTVDTPIDPVDDVVNALTGAEGPTRTNRPERSAPKRVDAPTFPSGRGSPTPEWFPPSRSLACNGPYTSGTPGRFGHAWLT